MVRDPRWTEEEASALLQQILADDGPAEPFGFSLDTGDPDVDARGVATGGLSGGDQTDFIGIDLAPDAVYAFLSLAGAPTALEIIDPFGFPLMFTDGNDLGIENDLTDTIVQFRPEVAGRHYLAVAFENRGQTGSYAVSGELVFDSPVSGVGNFAPIAQADAALTETGAVTRIPIMSNDYDPNAGDALSFGELESQPANGVAVVADGAILYRSDRGFVGLDTFEYTITDSRDAVGTGRVYVIVEEAEELGGVTRAEAQLVAYLFEAGLDRDGDIRVEGLNFWIGRLAAGQSERALATSFLKSPEFEAAFGDPLDPTDPDYLGDRELVQQLFRNVLNREGAQGGVDFWTGRLAAPDFDRADLLLAFANSPENLAGTPEVATLVYDADGPQDWVFG